MKWHTKFWTKVVRSLTKIAQSRRRNIEIFWKHAQNALKNFKIASKSLKLWQKLVEKSKICIFYVIFSRFSWKFCNFYHSFIIFRVTSVKIYLFLMKLYIFLRNFYIIFNVFPAFKIFFFNIRACKAILLMFIDFLSTFKRFL